MTQSLEAESTSFSVDEELLELLEEQNRRWERERLEKSLAAFVREAWQVVEPSTVLVWNWHIDAICEHLEAVSCGQIRNLIINVPPGTMKSLLVSVFWPAWDWAKYPHLRWIYSSYSSDLSIRDSNRMRMLLHSDWYKSLWATQFALTKANETRLENSKTGFRVASSTGGLGTGERVHRAVNDDLLRANDAHSQAMRNQAIEHLRAMSTRGVGPGEFRQVLIMQRLHEEDPAGWLLREQPGRWEHLRLPAEFEPADCSTTSIGWRDPRTKEGELLWPQQFPPEEIEVIKEALGEFGTAGQLQQRPSPAGGGILKKRWWQEWPADKPMPTCDHIFYSWDTAYSEDDLETNSCSAYTGWGIFWHEVKSRYCLILLDAWDGRVDYPDLREKAQHLERDKHPDRHLIEKKASGQSLIQDLRRAGVMVSRYNPDRDKVARAYAVQAMLQAGLIWYVKRRWAERVIDALAAFPQGAPPSKDYTDTATQAWLYLRNGWWLQHPDDPEDDEMPENNERRLYG